jgi:hypothetical protein
MSVDKRSIVPSKVIKKTAKVIQEQDSADAIYARAKRKAAREAGQVNYVLTAVRLELNITFMTELQKCIMEKMICHEYNTVVGMKRWFEMNKDINKRYGFNNPTDFDKAEIARLKKLGISV